MSDQLDGRQRALGFDVYAVTDQDEIARRKKVSRKRRSTNTACIRCDEPSDGEVRCRVCTLAAIAEAKSYVEHKRNVRHCDRGHTQIGKNVRIAGDGTRSCRACEKQDAEAISHAS